MAPSVVEIPVEAPVIGKTLLKVAQKAPTASPIVPVKSTGAKNTLASPLKISPDSALLKLKHFDTTVPVGTDFPRGSVQITDLLTSPNSDDLLRDLAALVSQRGVVFFRAQHIDIEGQKELVTRLGELSGKPATSKLHIHPNTPEDSKLGDDIFPITSGQREKFKPNGIVNPLPSKKEFDEDKRASSFWHSDITYERIPSDYSTLKIHTHTAATGGDTIWASGYELYDRLSPAFRTLLEGKNAYHDGSYLNEHALRDSFTIRQERGSPENVGDDVSPIHPIIRTNPVTGWKAVFFNSLFVTRIIGVTKVESDALISYLHRLATDNSDLQARFRWEKYADDPNAHDVAVWDNRSSLHTAIDDYFEIGGERFGDRAVSLGEKPYYDPNSKSRREDLGHPLHTSIPVKGKFYYE